MEVCVCSRGSYGRKWQTDRWEQNVPRDGTTNGHTHAHTSLSESLPCLANLQ